MSTAAGDPSREAGLRRLHSFAHRAGPQYAKSRNFDFGPERRGNVSMLSPYLRHRLILEQEVLEAVLQHHSPNAASKFVQEVFWRTYFKGWLEQRPSVWADYRRTVARLLQTLDGDAEMLHRYETAIKGNTGIDCFDAWARELMTHGYLHNHARMWFASIWVFTLGLPCSWAPISSFATLPTAIPRRTRSAGDGSAACIRQARRISRGLPTLLTFQTGVSARRASWRHGLRRSRKTLHTR